MDVLLSTTFMSGGSSPDTKLGHLNEPIIMGNALKQSCSGKDDTIFDIIFAVEVGLVRNKKHKHIHASPDFLLVIQDQSDGKKYIVFCEVKTRTKSHTAYPDMKLMPGTSKFVSTTAGTSHCMKYISRVSEWYQLIHQAATLDINRGLFLVGDKAGNIILGVWIYFPPELLTCYRRCMDDIHNSYFKFTKKALNGNEYPEFYITDEDKKRINGAIDKQSKVDYESFVYNFKMWVAMRKLDLPLLSSKKCIPLLPSLWNRCKNGSDVATGMIRGSWYSLPTPARTPQALVVQRILFLITINIMKVGNAISYKQSTETREDIDKFRTRTNKLIGSYRGFILQVRKKCLVPALRREQVKKGNAHDYARRFDSEIQFTPTRATNLTVHMDVEPRRTRSSLHKDIVHLKDSNPNIRITGETPPQKKSGQIEGQNRRVLCNVPFFTFLCGKDGKQLNGKVCGICKRKTTFYCMGCHQYFCNLPPKKKKDNITEELKKETEIIEINLGKKKKWQLTGNSTSGGKNARRKIEHDFSVSMKSTCMILAHMQKLKDV